jgi:hypothetical protein
MEVSRELQNPERDQEADRQRVLGAQRNAFLAPALEEAPSYLPGQWRGSRHVLNHCKSFSSYTMFCPKIVLALAWACPPAVASASSAKPPLAATYRRDAAATSSAVQTYYAAGRGCIGSALLPRVQRPVSLV